MNLELSQGGLQATLDGGVESRAVVAERGPHLGGGSPSRHQSLPDAREGVGETLPQPLGMAGGVGLGYLLSQQLALTGGDGEGRRREGERKGEGEVVVTLTAAVQLMAADGSWPEVYRSTCPPPSPAEHC